MRTRRDIVAIVLIWSFVLVATFVAGAKTNDPGGAGETGGILGAALTSAYFWVRKLRYRDSLIPASADVGSATAAWLKAVLAIALWVAGSVIAIIVGVPDAYAVVLAWLLPLAVFLVWRFRRSARRT